MNDSNEKKGGHGMDYALLLLPSGLFIGLGVGFIFDQLVGWTLLGIGLGFMAAALARFND